MFQRSNILLLLIIIVYFLITYYNQAFFITDELFRNSFGWQMSESQFNEYLVFSKKWQWVSYIFVPFALLIRIGFVWVCFKAGSFIADRFTTAFFWKICTQAEIVFAVGAVAGLLYTEFFVEVETLEQLSVKPFSLNVFAAESMPKWSAYFFNTLNIFEFAYVLFLAYLLAEESKIGFFSSLKFVATTYLPGLALWVLLVSYLSVVFQS
jgi:hypothetical protein